MSSTAPPNPASPPRERVEWLDLLRGVAVLCMIETHVVNTFLEPRLRAVPWFDWLDWWNGLIAPTFLLIAGWVSTMGWSAAPGKPPAVWRKTKRLLGVAALGYALHLPWDDLAAKNWSNAIRIGSQVDVLQCLATALFIVLLVQWLAARLAPRARSALFFGALSLLAAVALGAAPAAAVWREGPVPLVAFLNPSTGSLFPLFPWAAFVFVGAIFGGLRLGAPVLAVAGLVVGILGWFLRPAAFSAVSVAFFLERLAWVMMLAAIFQWAARHRQPRPLRFAGQHSLFIYAFHLQLISWLGVAGLRNRFGWPGVAGLFVLVFASTWISTLAWASRRANGKGCEAMI